MANVFSRSPVNRPGRSVFNLSYSKTMVGDMGQLLPVMHDEVIPGDTFTIGNEMVIRFLPMVAPILHAVTAFVHYFFVPYRLLWSGWEDFISGGVDGANAGVLPRWSPTANTEGSLWDLFGFPLGIVPNGALPMKFVMNAYNLIYNKFYRDETQIAEISLDNEYVRLRSWAKDYFTSALPWQQRGTAPALPVSGHSHAVWPLVSAGTAMPMQYNIAVDGPFDSLTKLGLEQNTVDLSTATTFNVSDLRLAFQIQRWLERNATGGARYTEFLRAHFGVAPRDERLQRPEYIGGSKAPVIFSEVLQTSKSETGAPQGNLAGHGIGVDKQFVGKYTANEFGLIMGILSIMPQAMYHQGIPRQWLRTTRYDFPFPEFAHLSEQAVTRAEVYATAVSNDNNTIFGYQGRFDELRVKQNMVTGAVRPGQSLDFWTLARHFSSAPGLNQTFIECVPTKRYLAAQNSATFIISFGNVIKAIRPLPIEPNPGLIDH